MTEETSPIADSPTSPPAGKTPETREASPDRLVWVDMEMSGLDPDTNRILEVALVVTDADLQIIAEGPVVVVHQTDAHLDAMDDWNKGTHGRSGLIEKVKSSHLDEASAQQVLLDFMKAHVGERLTPMCGNTVHQDRRFMANYMPGLEAYFHYRNLDVSTVKELARRWHPALYKGFTKKGAHTALADILESIEELRYYRTTFFRLADQTS